MSNFNRWQLRYAFYHGTSTEKAWGGGSGFRSSAKVKKQRKKDRRRTNLLTRGILKLRPLFFSKKKKTAKEQKGDKA